MPTLASSASCYKICAWSKHEKQWIDASASLIHDTDPNWVSHKLIERLNGQAPRPIFRDVNNVRQKFLGEDTFTWYKEDSPSENRGTVFQIRPKNENLPCDMGIQKCLLFPNEPTVTEGIAVMLDNSNEEHTEKGFTKPEAQDREGEDNEQNNAKKWFEALHKDKDMKVNIFEDSDGEPSADKDSSADQWFRDLEKHILSRVGTDGPLSHSSLPPRIAILDTGLDEEHPAIMACAENFRGLKSFTDNDTQDYHGHGTFIASLILKVAPRTHLYIAKVAERRLLPLKHNISEAIMWAVEQDVDIITMSFGMENNDDDIARAIREAYNRSIIIFAAASNGGGNQKLTYPARNAEVIAIYATDGKGNKSGFNPTPKSRGLNFAVPGEAIKSAWTTYPNASGKPQTKRKSGTSYATPIAAGIAALILDFAKSNEVPWYAKLRDRHGMSNVFEAMAGHRDGYDYICPWEQLFKKEDSLESILGSIRKEVVNK